MIKSMTGFGDAAGQVDAIVYNVEIKAINSRYLKTKIKMPEEMGFLEEKIDKILRTKIARGTVNFTLKMQTAEANIVPKINVTALAACVQQVKDLLDNERVTVDLASLLTIPSMMEIQQPANLKTDEACKAILEIAEQGLDKLCQMRLLEGKEMADDLTGNIKAITEALEKVQKTSANLPSEYRDKLHKRVDELLADSGYKVVEELIAREVAIFADKSDIAEEIIRLTSHVKQFEDNCLATEPIGRKLDFITQEMLREANTIASKTADSEVMKLVVDIKCRIDRIKEQVQNIE